MFDGLLHGRSACCLYAIYLAVGVDALDCASNTGNQTAATNGNEYNVSFGQFFHDFQTNSTLTCHYIFIIEGMQECVALFLLQFYCLCSSIIIYTGNQNNFCAVALCSFNLSQRSACGHADSSLDAFFLCCQSNALCMVTCGTSDYTLGSFFFCQACCFYISTSQLEGACYLHIFAFDKYVCVRVDKSGFVQRCYSCNAFQCFFCVLNHFQCKHFSSS